MSAQLLRDSSERLIGKIEDAGGGRLCVKDQGGSVRGYNDLRSDRTTRHDGTFIGTGNLLATLVR